MPSIHSGPRALRQDGARFGANRVIVFMEIKHSRKAFTTANRIPRKKMSNNKSTAISLIPSAIRPGNLTRHRPSRRDRLSWTRPKTPLTKRHLNIGHSQRAKWVAGTNTPHLTPPFSKSHLGGCVIPSRRRP